MTSTTHPETDHQSAVKFVREHNRMAIMSHVNPDADAIGSSLGLALGLRALGKDTSVVLSDPVPRYCRFLPGAEDILAALPADLDALICADAAGIDRVGTLYTKNPRPFAELPILNLDHHQTNPRYGTVNLVEPQASSTSELSYRLLLQLGAPIDAGTATALLFGIVGDTGSFRNGATTPGSLSASSELVELGADVQRIAFALFEAKSFAAARLWGRIISCITLDRERHIVFGDVTQAMLREEGAESDDAEGVAEYLRGVEEAEVVMLLKETPEGEVRVSMRSRPGVDVSIVAASFGGGGHRQAAGCTLPGPLDAARTQLVGAYDTLNDAAHRHSGSR
ncbi:MAG: DHH family phosphoesterase [Chloroflexota bacterium]